MASTRRPRRGPAAVSRLWTAIEFLLGAGLLGAAALAGLLLARRPGPNRVDAAGFFFVPSDPSSHLANELVKIGSLPVLLAGIGVIFSVAIFRDWVRSLACAVSPIAAVEVVEHIAKPMVGREIGAGSFTYPSGTVTAVAALAAAAFLVSPRLLRPLSTVAGALLVAGAGWAVLVLRWHYPTDVLGGIWVGGGAVFLIDSLAHLPWLVVARQPVFGDRPRAPATDPPLQTQDAPRRLAGS
ncbi:MAG: phosphatase PAP2 family protein [Acidimicrobiales bacterium]